ncbi:hypothetical protein V8F33_012122 [Rhypophila sp. PSN 637]
MGGYILGQNPHTDQWIFIGIGIYVFYALCMAGVGFAISACERYPHNAGVLKKAIVSIYLVLEALVVDLGWPLVVVSSPVICCWAFSSKRPHARDQTGTARNLSRGARDEESNTGDSDEWTDIEDEESDTVNSDELTDTEDEESNTGESDEWTDTEDGESNTGVASKPHSYRERSMELPSYPEAAASPPSYPEAAVLRP